MVSVIEKLKRLAGNVGMEQVEVPAPVGETLETTAIAQFTVPASAPAGTTVNVTLQLDPRIPGTPSIQVPINEVWEITDITIKGTPAVDAVVYFIKNGKDVVLGTSPLSAYNSDSPGREKITPVTFKGGDIISVQAVTVQPETTATNQTITFNVKIRRYVY